MIRSVPILLFITLFPIAASNAYADNWTRFRGPNGQGASSEKNLPLKWSTDENIIWKTEIPGRGWSSPIVFENKVFLTSADEDGVSCRVICVDRTTGVLEWNTEVHRQEPGAMRRQNSYATPTPVTDGKHVYAVFYDGTMVAVDYSGKRVWKCDEVRFFSLHGLGASPIVVDGKVIMPFDGSSREESKVGWKIPWPNAVLLSVDAETGTVNWKGKRGQSRVGHVTPILIEDGTQCVSAAGDRVQAHNIKSGERVWSIYSKGEGVTPSPVIGDGLIYTSSGFEEPTIRAIRMGGQGDVTETHIAWEQTKGVPAMPSLLYIDPLLYTITRDNILHCMDAKSGDVVWRERLNGVHSASPVFADGRIYILSEDGETRVIRPGRKYEEIGRNTIEGIWKASMAVSQGQLFLRSTDHLYCVGK